MPVVLLPSGRRTPPGDAHQGPIAPLSGLWHCYVVRNTEVGTLSGARGARGGLHLVRFAYFVAAASEQFRRAR
jgi:hypothetical protein